LGVGKLAIGSDDCRREHGLVTDTGKVNTFNILNNIALTVAARRSSTGNAAMAVGRVANFQADTAAFADTSKIWIMLTANY